MLASRCAWAILRADHARMRELLASIAELMRDLRRDNGRSRRTPEVARLRQLIESLQSFDQESHRPKGIALMQALRGRSPDADRLLEDLEHERDSGDASLSRAVALLDVMAGGNESAGSECETLLAHYRERVLHHLEQEDTVLCAHSERLLTEQEWSHVVSQISSSLYPPAPSIAGS